MAMPHVKLGFGGEGEEVGDMWPTLATDGGVKQEKCMQKYFFLFLSINIYDTLGIFLHAF